MNSAKLTVGTNSKLGRGRGKVVIGNFNLPAVSTCPGASDLCREKCYATRGRFQCTNVVARARMNYEGSLASGFVELLSAQCSKVDVTRLHSSGDFYSPTYVRDWTRIARACPDAVFGAYTRSWAISRFLPALREFAALPNVQLFLSTDPTMAQVPPDGFRHAYMHPDWERPADSFRCPNQLVKERGRKPPTCVQCQLCYRAPGKYPHVEFVEH